MLSTLARGCGSWAGDLEVAKDGTVGHRKPVLVSSLAGEDTKFLEKSVNIPLRVKSAVGSAVANTSSTRLVPSADSLVNAIKEKTPKTQYSRPKSVCSSPQRPEAFREKLSRSKSAASIYSKKPKADLATNTSSSSTFAKYGTKFQSVSVQHARSKEALVKALTSSSEVKSHRPDGQIELPKTYMTRKGALMLFTTPENLLFSETDQKCYFKNDQDGKNVGKLSLTLGTVNKLTKSVLQYGSHLQNEDSDSDDNSFREETHMQFIRDEEGSQEVVDYRAQPGADFVFYLRDMQSRSMVRSLARTPSQQSLVSVDSAGELTAALQSIDHRGSPEVRATPEVRGLLSPDVRRLASPSQRLNLSSAGSVRQQSRSALSRPSTSASGRSSSLSAERLAASLKSSPYLGHPIKAPYPSNLVSYQPSQDTCPRHGSARSRQSSLVRQESAHSTQSRIASSAHSVRSHVSSLGGASQGSKGMLTAEDCGLERPGSENAHSIALSHEGSLIVANDDVSYHGDSIRSGGLSPQYYQGPEESLFEADFVVSNDVVTDMTSQHNDVTSFNADEDWPQEQQVYSPVHYYGSRPSTASHHTYISGTTSLPTTIQDSQLDPNTLPLEDRLDQDALLVDHDALLLDNPVEEDNTLDMLQESANSGQWPVDSGQWPVDSGQERFSPALSARLKSPSSDCPPGSQAKSPSPRPQAVSPVPSGRSSMSQGRGQLETEALLADGYDILPSSTADKDEISSVSKGTSPVPSEKAVTSEPQVEGVLPTEGAVQDQLGSVSVSPSEVVPDHAPSLPARRAGLADVVNRVRENEMGVPYTTLVPPKLGPTVDKTAKVGGAAVRRSPSPEVKVTPEAKKPPAPSKKISKLDLGSLKSMVKPPAAKSGSPRVGRKSKAKGVRPKATGVQFIDSLNIDSYQGPSEDEVEKMVQEELAKELETSQLNEEGESMPFLVVPEERADDAASLATDDEALEKELKKQAEPGKMKKSKKSLAKEKAALREARRQEKVRREEELKALERKKKEKEEQKRREKIAEQRRIQVAKEELEDAAQEAERAAQAEEEARQMLLDARRQAREERETRRKAELEKRKLEKEQQRQERRKMEEAARLREQEMAERLASAAEKRRLREEAEWERQEQERLEQEEREREEEEEKRRLEEEEERIRELEREAEEEAIARLVKEREEAERRMRIAREEAERQRQEEERLRLEEEKRKADEEERQKRQEAEAERKRQEELERIKRIQKLEEEARERVQRELARRRAWALRRRELNQAQRDHLNSMRQTQGMTRPWVFSYYVHWPKENYERRMFVAKKKSFRPRPKPKPKPDAKGQGKP